MEEGVVMTEDYTTIRQKIEEAYNLGILTEEEYRNKLEQIEQTMEQKDKSDSVIDETIQEEPQYPKTIESAVDLKTENADTKKKDIEIEDDGIVYFDQLVDQKQSDSITYVKGIEEQRKTPRKMMPKEVKPKRRKKKIGCIVVCAIIMIPVLFIIIPLCLSSSDDRTSTTDNKKIATEDNVTANEKDMYAFRCNQWEIYAATMLSDSVVKVEKWGRVIADEENPFEYENDVMTVTIDDENKDGFYWLNKDQTAFCINLKESDDEDLKKGPSVPFVKTTNKFISSANYANSIYTYTSDRWTMYVASKLSDSVVKIEKWDRTIADEENPFEYWGDICVINTQDSSSSDFTWLDDEKTSFTVTLYDNAEDDLKKGVKQTFTISKDFKQKNDLSSLELPTTDYSKGSYTKPKTAHKIFHGSVAY